MSNKPIVLIFGAGPRVGAALITKFASLGYEVATASRKAVPQTGAFAIQADFSKPASIPGVFAAVKEKFNSAPSVVIYNAAALTPPPEDGNVLSISAESFVNDLNINTVSAYVAAQEAIKGWGTLPSGTKKSFIYTGNILNTVVVPVPLMLTLGVGKSASAYWLGVADAVYAPKGIRFFYADERHGDGKSKGAELDAEAHAEFFPQLVEHAEVPWHATFVKGNGYAQFK